jgi:hypothetical protein
MAVSSLLVCGDPPFLHNSALDESDNHTNYVFIHIAALPDCFKMAHNARQSPIDRSPRKEPRVAVAIPAAG